MAFVAGIIASILFEFVIVGFLRTIGFYTTVQEGHAKVYLLFGRIAGVLDDPGLHLLWPKFTWKALLLPWVGKVYELDLRLDQRYLRSQPVNSEEGAPMGVGIWYEMFISDPVNYLFKNSDPQGSLAANVGNATVRCLSNMPLGRLLEDRHFMSQTVRSEAGTKSSEWGYKLGSVYIRKVHFRDIDMIRQIESKVVNRLRQVTASIKQDGENQVNIITSSAQRTAAVEFAKAAAIRPRIVGDALKEIAKDQAVYAALFENLEVQKILESHAQLVLVPRDKETLNALIATEVPQTQRVGKQL